MPDVTPADWFARKLREAVLPRNTGLAGCVVWFPGVERLHWAQMPRWDGTPEIAHSELARDPSLAFWDLPGYTPSWIAVALGQEPVALTDAARAALGGDHA